MKLTRCMHNHYYDGSKHSKCPHCVEKGFIPSDEEKLRKDIPALCEYVDEKHEPKDLSAVSIHPPLRVTSSPEYGNSDTKTTDLIHGINADPAAAVPPQSDTGVVNQPAVSQKINEEATDEQVNTESLPDVHLPEKNEDQSSLQNEISSVRQFVGQDSKTVAFYDVEATEPTVGWLIALNGAYVGESFTLKAGRNNIGRWTKMDVALPQEASVSRDRHAILTYDPSGRKFFIQPGEGNALVYLNDEILLVPSLLKDEDVIKLGECKLLFKLLCGDTFTWDTYLRGEK